MNVRKLYFTARGLKELAKTEWETWSSVSKPLYQRLRLWRRGFLSHSSVLYDLETSNEYVSDYQRYIRTKRINGTWSVVLSNKLLFHWLMESFSDHRMEVYGMVRSGTFHSMEETVDPQQIHAEMVAPFPSLTAETTTGIDCENRTDAETQNAGDWVVDRLQTEEKLVLKWVRGGGGNNVFLCSRTDDGYDVNGDVHSEREFTTLVDDLEEFLVCEFVEQGWFPAERYPETPNTIRIITMYDEDADEAFVPAAVQRIGTTDSAPMDNFSQGGLSAAVDLKTGELGVGVQRLPGENPTCHSHHPDTGTAVTGTRIPGWEEIKETVLDIADAHPYVPYVGWDVIVTGSDGEFTVIEGNSYPGLKSIQAHGPLLADDRVRQFYESHGVC